MVVKFLSAEQLSNQIPRKDTKGQLGILSALPLFPLTFAIDY
jgi:hypothetical protein